MMLCSKKHKHHHLARQMKKLTAGLLLGALSLTPCIVQANDALPPQSVTDFINSRVVMTGDTPLMHPVDKMKEEEMQALASASVSPQATGNSASNSGGEESGPSVLNEDVQARIKVDDSVSPETTDLLGEQIDLNTGSLSFKQTDVSLPGNSQLPVSMTRTFKGAQFTFGNRLELADWSIDIPHIHTTLIVGSDGFSGSWGLGKECSGALAPAGFYNLGTFFRSNEYWNGDTLNIPGVVNEKLLTNNGNIQPDTATYPKVTQSNFIVSCFARVDGNGEGFLVTSPDGTKYTFDMLKLVTAPGIFKDFKVTGRKQAHMLVSRVEDRFGNTVTYHYDDQQRLTSIVGADVGEPNDRTIVLKYEHDAPQDQFVSSIQTNGRVWQYIYSAVGGSTSEFTLDKVVRPDNKFWDYDLGSVVTASVDSTSIGSSEAEHGNGEDVCFPGTFPDAEYVGTIKHPEGVLGRYTVSPVLHGRSNVPRQFEQSSSNDLARRCFNSMAIVAKQLTGPELTTLDWSYSYSENVGYFSTDIHNVPVPPPAQDVYHYLQGLLPDDVNALHNRRTTVVSPDNSKTEYYHNRDFSSHQDGKLVATRVFDTDGSTPLKTTYTDYVQGHSVGVVEMLFENALQHNIQVLTDEARTVLHHASGPDSTYVQDSLTFNLYGMTEKTHAHNDATNSHQYIYNTYTQDTINWVLNLPLVTSVSKTDSNYKPVSGTTYHSETLGNAAYKDLNLPYERKRYDQWVTRNAEYHPDGNVRKVEYNRFLKDALGKDVEGSYRYQTLTSYHRGQPRMITVANRYNDTAETALHISREVDDNGWVTSIKDLNDNETSYGYDDIGRVIYINAVDDSNNWLDTYFEWSGVDVSPLTRTIHKCKLNATKTGCENAAAFTSKSTFDGLLRPVLTENKDVALNQSRYQNQQFNAYNSPVFTSYWSTSATESAGNGNVYDGLQRLKSSGQIDGGTTYLFGSMTHTYLSGNKMQVSDQRNNVTTTTYQAYGAPAYEQPTFIESPEDVSTSIDINVFGDVNSITQTGKDKAGKLGALSHVEYRAYDDQHNLCKTVRKDVGTTVFNRNVLGEVQWQAQGVSGGTTADCESNATKVGHADENKVVSFAYDNLGAMHHVDYIHATTPDVTHILDNNGNLESLVSGNVTHTYNYNSLNLLKDETLIVNGKRFAASATDKSLVYGYDTQGYVNALTYPDGDVITYAPNGFGEPTQVIRGERTAGESLADRTYAMNASYYPVSEQTAAGATGSLEGFTYGNGFIHKTNLNNRNVPSSIKDVKTSLNALHYEYEYDNNLNVTRLLDKLAPEYSLGENTVYGLSYDGLDRLTATAGGSGIGSSAITYDGLGNITKYQSKDRDYDYFYDTNNRLTKVNIPGASPIPIRDMQYDDRGNVTDNAMLSFTYNRANQMVNAVGTDKSYLYDGHNRRVKQTDSNGTSYSLYGQDGTLLYRETVDGGINYIYLGKKLIAKDGFIAETAGKQHYRPYGESIEGETDGIGYTGHKFDTDLGLSYMQARYYDPVIGRFYSNDPVGFRDVHSFNRYAYANNNPYKFTDPDGNNPVAVASRAAAAQISASTTTVAAGSVHNPFQPIGKPTTPTITAPNISPAAVAITIGALANIPPDIISSIISWATGSEPDFIADSDGVIVDLEATPPGSYDQPGGGRTDVLQDSDHGTGRTHTHNPIINTNPNTGESFINGKNNGDPVSFEDAQNIENGSATRSANKKRT